ncbi:Gfo/Idh/MocA family oxidoreductase [Neobacillus sp. PS3-34]|uniref:Gfo/Idh/MocA family protein n=1 Tax=Neobacillus sp. PS3-34 TaxID=3070678 RepID=UPI0027E0A6D6|nr:Gfo/Idh/MocA family oxidoreductase [Neobacillus sp. PS3-34]WML48344.1 Gfo/Idh/MocA family oxidoreductase [Neobacillus sp. PS3-34]
MKIGIVSFAHMHAHSYATCLLGMEDVELFGIADENEERGREASKKYHTRYFKNYQDLLAGDIDGVIICTENAMHMEVAVAAAEMKKHILCEKPLATNVEDAWKMVEAAKQHGVKLQTAFPVRYNAPIQRVKQMIHAGELGRIVAIRGTNRGQNPGGWFVDEEQSGGGAVLDHTVHVIDLMRWFLDSEVREVYAEIDTRFSDIPIDDCGLLTLEFENGVFASHDPSWSRCKTFPTWGDVTLEIIGTNGVTRVDAFAQNLMLYSDKNNKVSREFWGNDMDKGLIADFVRCIQEDLEPSISGYDGLKAMEVALAAYESAKLKEPVKL